MSNQLTAKQESFCQAIADGLNQSDAYRHAYEAGRMKPEALWVEASKLADNPKVALRIQELRDAVTAGKAWSFEQGMEEIETNIRLSRFLGQMAAARAATKDALELSGLLEPKVPNADIKITKVTVVLHPDGLPPGYQVPETVEGSSRVLPSGECVE